MDEVIDRMIKDSGEMWWIVRARNDSPVLITKEVVRGATVWELTMEEGAKHPYWTIHERSLTDDEWRELGNNRGITPIGTIYPIASSDYKHRIVRAYIKNGRMPAMSGWTISTEPVKVIIEKVES